MPTEVTTCYRHPGVRAGVSCQRCDRPICPQCMVQASVGFHCPECTKTGRQRVYRGPAALAPSRPIVTQVLIGINVVVYVVGLGLSGANDLTRRGGLVGEGTFDGINVVGVAAGEWYRIVTSGFLHADLLHLAFNMFMLWVLGSMLEPSMGKGPFLVTYAMSLIAGSLGVLVLDPNVVTVGASGAVFGLMGAAIIGQKANGISPWHSGIGGLLVINLALTFIVPGISIGGHVGGLLGGMAAGAILILGRRRLPSEAAAVAICVALTAGMAWACVAVANAHAGA